MTNYFASRNVSLAALIAVVGHIGLFALALN